MASVVVPSSLENFELFIEGKRSLGIVDITLPKLTAKTVDIEGMHCENCKNSIERSVNKIDGASCQVNLKKKQATIEVDREIDDADIRIAIERLDFKVTGITTNRREE